MREPEGTKQQKKKKKKPPDAQPTTKATNLFLLLLGRLGRGGRARGGRRGGGIRGSGGDVIAIGLCAISRRRTGAVVGAIFVILMVAIHLLPNRILDVDFLVMSF